MQWYLFVQLETMPCLSHLTPSHPIPSHPKSCMSFNPSLSPAAPESQAVIWLLLSPSRWEEKLSLPLGRVGPSLLSPFHSVPPAAFPLTDVGGWAQVVLIKLKFRTSILKISVLKLPQAAVIQSPSSPSSVAERRDWSRKRRMHYSCGTYIWDWLGLFKARLNVLLKK